MQPEDVQKLIESGLTGATVTVTGDGSHFEAVVVSDVFAGQSIVNRQRLVYQTLGNRITSGEIHALSIKTYTLEEWEAARKLRIS